jgi:hypothetical protein
MNLMDTTNLSFLLSVMTSVFTGYCWLFQMNRDRAPLRLYRASPFRPDRLQSSPLPGKETATWYGEIGLANPSSLPRSVIGVEVELRWRGTWLPGRLVLDSKVGVPWTVEPLRVLNRSFGCAFPVDEGTPREALTAPQQLRFTLIMIDGRRRAHEISTSDTTA